MRTRTWFVGSAALVLTASLVVAGNRSTVLRGQSRQDVRLAAVPSEKGGQDIFGAYEAVANWPKPLSALPGHEKWTWGAGQSVFAESPNRVFILQRGELPNRNYPHHDPFRPRGRSASQASGGDGPRAARATHLRLGAFVAMAALAGVSRQCQSTRHSTGSPSASSQDSRRARADSQSADVHRRRAKLRH